MEVRTVRVPGARLHVQSVGHGEPMLWITGFGIGSAVFDPLVPLFADEFRCITYDNRGAGRSSVPWTPTSMPELAADAVRVLDALGVDAAHVHGVSMGGMVAQELALRFPDRVRGLVLQGTSPGGPHAVAPRAEALAAMALQRVPLPRERRVPLLRRVLVSEGYVARAPEELEGHLNRLGADRAPVRGALMHLVATLAHDTVSRLPGLQAPTLVVHGSDDRMVSVRNARLLAERIPGATLELIEGAGHLPLLEQPGPVHRLIADWLAGPGAVGPGTAHTSSAAALERWTRVVGLQVGTARAMRSAWEASLVGRGAHRRSPRP